MNSQTLNVRKFKISRNFGHRPRNGLKGKLYSFFTWAFGITNLVKRQQMRDLFAALNPTKNDVIVDFGCSSGYISMELAKYVKKAIGVDIKQNTSQVPDAVKNSVEFRSYDGQIDNIPVQKEECNKILAGEVLQAIDNNEALFAKFHQILMPEGELYVLHGVGRPVIEKAYDNNHWLLNVLRKFGGPKSYEEYQGLLNEEFRATSEKFITTSDIKKDMENAGFKIDSEINTPVDSVVYVVDWAQFILKVVFGKSRHLNNPIVFLLLTPVCEIARLISDKREIEYCVLIKAIRG